VGNACKNLVETTEEKGVLERPVCKLNDSIKLILQNCGVILKRILKEYCLRHGRRWGISHASASIPKFLDTINVETKEIYKILTQNFLNYILS
jgi:hypothetical protein